MGEDTPKESKNDGGKAGGKKTKKVQSVTILKPTCHGRKKMVVKIDRCS